MAETFTPSPAAPPATYSLPNNTELADAETHKTAVLKPMANALAYEEAARVLAAASLAALRNQRPALSIVGTTISIGSFAAYFPAAGKFVADAGSSFTTGGLANNTWYYLYATYTAGLIGYVVSTTAVAAGLQNMVGDVDKIYLGCWRTDGAATPITVRSCGGRYFYEDVHQVLTTGSASSYTTVSLAARVPPHARTARLWATLYDSTAVPNFLRIRPKYSSGSSASSGALIVKVEITSDTQALESEVAVQVGQGVEYAVDTTNAGTSANIYVTGYSEG